MAEPASRYELTPDVTFGAIGRIEPMALTSELSIRYLRPAKCSVLWARASLESAGSRSIVGSVKVWCDDREHKPSSVAQGTYVLPRRDGSRADADAG